MMKQFFKEYFTFNKSDRNGIIFLLIVLLLVVLLPYSFPLFKTDTKIDFSEFETEIDQLLAKWDAEREKAEKLTEQGLNTAVYAREISKVGQLPLFNFNPNELTVETGRQLGLTEYVATNVTKYLAAGGGFQSTADFGRIYGLTEEEFQILKPYIDIPQRSQRNVEDVLIAEAAESELPAIVKPMTLFEFNPNELDSAMASQLGLPNRISGNIIKYRESGGAFYKPEDLKKLYGMEEEMYVQLAPYIVLPAPKPRFDYENFVTNINQDGVERIMKLRGIGEVIAMAVIEYRERLGGFVNTAQLKEVFGINDSLYQSIGGHISLGEMDTRKININTATEEELAEHPYISYKVARSIVNMKAQHGDYLHITQLNRSFLINEELSHKLAPYLTVK